MDVPRFLLYYLQMPKKTVRKFFSVSPLAGAALRLNGIGIREPMPAGFVNRPRGTGDWLIMCFHTRVRAGVSPEASWVPRGCLWIWPPDKHQFYGLEGMGYLHSWLHCEGSQVERILKSEGLMGRPLGNNVEADFLRLLGSLHREIASHRSPDEIIAGNLFENWLRGLRRSQIAEFPQISEPLRRVREYIDLHFLEPLSLKQLARLAGWSPGYFSEKFTETFGVPPIRYLIDLRLGSASYLLRDVNLTVTEVARRVGYEDVYHFSKLFKRHWGCSPLAYKKQG